MSMQRTPVKTDKGGVTTRHGRAVEEGDDPPAGTSAAATGSDKSAKKPAVAYTHVPSSGYGVDAKGGKKGENAAKGKKTPKTAKEDEGETQSSARREALEKAEQELREKAKEAEDKAKKLAMAKEREKLDADYAKKLAEKEMAEKLDADYAKDLQDKEMAAVETRSVTSSTGLNVTLRDLLKPVQKAKKDLHALLKKQTANINRTKLRNCIIGLGYAFVEYDEHANQDALKAKLQSQVDYAMKKGLTAIRKIDGTDTCIETLEAEAELSADEEKIRSTDESEADSAKEGDDEATEVEDAKVQEKDYANQDSENELNTRARSKRDEEAIPEPPEGESPFSKLKRKLRDPNDQKVKRQGPPPKPAFSHQTRGGEKGGKAVTYGDEKRGDDKRSYKSFKNSKFGEKPYGKQKQEEKRKRWSEKEPVEDGNQRKSKNGWNGGPFADGNGENQMQLGASARSSGSGGSSGMTDRSAGLRARLEQAKSLQKQITYQDELMPYPPGWYIPTPQEFDRDRKYTKCDFFKQIQRGTLKAFSGEVSDYFRFRQAFIRCVHVQMEDEFYKCLALDSLIKDAKTTALFSGLDGDEPGYRIRINLMEQEFGGEDRYRSHLVEKLTDFKGFKPHDVDAIGTFAKSLRSFLVSSNPLEAENLFLLKTMKKRLEPGVRDDYHMYLVQKRKEDNCISLCDYVESLHMARSKTRDLNLIGGGGTRSYETSRKHKKSHKSRSRGTIHVAEEVTSTSSEGEESGSASDTGAESSTEEDRGMVHKVSKAKKPAKIKQCWLCTIPSPHDILSCEEFVCAAVYERRKWAVEKKVCFLCLHTGHVNVNCLSKTRCKVCSGRHHWMLHIKRRKKEDHKPTAVQYMAQGQESGEEEEEHVTAVAWTMQNVDQPENISDRLAELAKLEVTLQVITVVLRNPLTKKKLRINILLDSGSNTNALDINAAKQLGLSGPLKDYFVTVAGGDTRRYDSFLAVLEIAGVFKGADFHKIAVQCYTKPCGDLTGYDWSEHQTEFDHLKDLELDPLVAGKHIGMILGTRNRELMLASENRQGELGEPIAEKTALGWTVCGPTKKPGHLTIPVSNAIMAPNFHLNRPTQYVWEDEYEQQLYEEVSSDDSDSGLETASQCTQSSENWANSLVELEKEMEQAAMHGNGWKTQKNQLSGTCKSQAKEEKVFNIETTADSAERAKLEKSTPTGPSKSSECTQDCQYKEEVLKIKKSMQDYWEFETPEECKAFKNMPNYKRQTKENEKALKDFQENLVRLEDGSYSSPLMWKTENGRDDIRCNYREAKEIFLAHEKRMMRDKDLHTQFVSTVTDWLNKGFAHYVEVVPEDHSYFIPTFMVVRLLNNSTKYRLIMNGKLVFEDGLCINDYLMSGPNLMNQIVDVLIRFMQGDYAASCDLASMFLKVKVPEKDQHCLRFFFRTHPDQPLRVVQCKVHVFGLKSSPFVAMSTLQKHARDRMSTHEVAAKALLRDIIVDDVLTSSDSLEDLQNMVDQLDDMLPEIDMHCHKFSANSEKILTKVHPDRRAKEAQIAGEDADSEHDPKEEKILKRVNALGVLWNSDEDCFQIHYDGDENETVTLRSVMRNCMRFYDPCGWYLPVQMGGRMLVQVAWKEQHEMDWDAELPPAFQKTWKGWIVDAKKVIKYKKKRCEKTKNKKVRKRVLVAFCDASSRAYAACVYLVTYYVDQKEKPTSTLIFARGKVASTKKRESIARLEAAGCVLAVEAARKVAKAKEMDMTEVRFYTDSMTCLYWMQTYKELSVYVGSRICQIRDYTDPKQWGHVRTKDNPADDPSRAVRCDTLMKKSLYETGPDWVVEPVESWPQFRIATETVESRAETKDFGSALEKIFIRVDRKIELRTPEETNLANTLHAIMGRKYALSKGLLSAMTFVHALEIWMQRALGKSPKVLNTLGKTQLQIRRITGEKKDARNDSTLEVRVSTRQAIKEWLIKMDQRHFFKEEVSAALYRAEQHRKYAQYDLFIDEAGILRIAGRMKHTKKAAPEVYCPALLHKDSALTEAILRDIHESKLNHCGGPYSLWNETRMSYFLIGGKEFCKKVLSGCAGCRRLKAQKLRNEDGPTHWSRIPREGVKVFERLGVDMCGPFQTKNRPGKTRFERCGIIFSCSLSRAVNIEMVDMQDGNSLYLAYKRHCSLYGRPKIINSDSGPNMKYLQKSLAAMWADWLSLVENRIVREEEVLWSRNVVYAPWWGGHYESLVGVLKRAMKHTIKWPRHFLNDEELRTAFREISTLMNLRPLTMPSGNANDRPSIRPVDFLNNGQGAVGATPMLGQPIPVGITKLKDEVDTAVKETWSRLMKELFHKLNESRTRHKGISLQIGDLVLVANSQWPDENWPLGEVVELIRSADQKVRTVVIRCKGELIKRSIRNLARLPYVTQPDEDRYVLYDRKKTIEKQ